MACMADDANPRNHTKLKSQGWVQATSLAVASRACSRGPKTIPVMAIAFGCPPDPIQLSYSIQRSEAGTEQDVALCWLTYKYQKCQEGSRKEKIPTVFPSFGLFKKCFIGTIMELLWGSTTYFGLCLRPTPQKGIRSQQCNYVQRPITGEVIGTRSETSIFALLKCHVVELPPEYIYTPGLGQASATIEEASNEKQLMQRPEAGQGPGESEC